MSGTAAMEYLGDDPRPRPRWVNRAAGAFVAALVVVGAVAWWSDMTRHSALDSLVAGFVAADELAASGERQVQGTLAYASPKIWSASVPEDVRADLRALVERSAGNVGNELAAVRAQVAGARILPWHADERRAQVELLALIDAQIARFEGIAADASDVDLVLAGGPLPTGAASSALRAAGASVR